MKKAIVLFWLTALCLGLAAALSATTAPNCDQQLCHADSWCYPVSPFQYPGGDLIHCSVKVPKDWKQPDGYYFYQSNAWNEYSAGVLNSGTEGGYHYGSDFSGSTGADNDIGDPVYAAANGYVEHDFHITGKDNWGTTCVLRHHLPDGNTAWTVYAHLESSKCSTRPFFWKGEQVGILGNANGYYKSAAHLHFEVLVTELKTQIPGWTLEENSERVLGHGYSFSALGQPEDGRRAYNWSHYTNPLTFIEVRRQAGVQGPCGYSCVVPPSQCTFTSNETLTINNTPAVKVVWSGVADANFYQLTKYDPATNQPLATANLVSATEYIDTEVEQNQEVRYELTAVNNAGSTPASNTVTVTPFVWRDPPEDFTLIIGESRCRNYIPAKSMWWGESFGAEYYEVYRNGTFVAGALQGRDYTDFNLQEGITYTWEVRGLNEVASHPALNTVSDTIPVGTCVAPTPPTATTEVALPQSIYDVQFRGTFNPNGYSTNYWFEWGASTGTYTNSTNPLNIGAGTTPGLWTFITWVGCDTTAYYRAVAQNDGGTAYGSELSLTTGLCSVAAPSNLVATLNPDNTVDLSWTDNSTNEDNFQIYWLAPGNPDYIIRGWAGAANITSWQDDLSAQADGEHCYKVATYSIDLGTGTFSTPACITKPLVGGETTIFADGFESGDTSSWSQVVGYALPVFLFFMTLIGGALWLRLSFLLRPTVSSYIMNLSCMGVASSPALT